MLISLPCIKTVEANGICDFRRGTVYQLEINENAISVCDNSGELHHFEGSSWTEVFADLYFPELSELVEEENLDAVINLDSWLGSRRRDVMKHLNPLDFARDCQVNKDEAIDVFAALSVIPRIKLLNVITYVECSHCQTQKRLAGLVKSGTFHCNHCGKEIKVQKEKCAIFFELIKEPKRQVPMKNYAEELGLTKCNLG